MTAQLAPTPIFKAFGNDGTPLAGGLLYTYAAGTTTPQASYTDSSQSTPNTNPIVLNFRGECALWLDATLSYKLNLTDSQGNQISGYPIDNVASGVASTASPSIIPAISNTYTLGNASSSWANLYIGPIKAPIYDTANDFVGYYGRSAAEIAVSVVPTDYSWPWGDPRRFGAVGNGATDDTTALTNWAKVGGKMTVPALTFLISATIPLVSYSSIVGVEGGVITTATHDISMLQATSQTNISITGVTVKMTSAGTAANVGGIDLITCNDCQVENCEFIGMQFSGIKASGVQRCTFRANYIHDVLGTGQDSGDIYMESTASVSSKDNVIDGNFCLGTTFEFGIACWDPYSGLLPLRNIICNNRIMAHNGYGILIYMPDSGDSYNQIIGNHVQDISAHSTNTSSGTGIYIEGAGNGGTQCIGNTVKNCCITTSAASLAPAGIGVNGGPAAGGVPLVIANNTVSEMTQYHGILVTGCDGATITGNSVRMPLTQTTLGQAIAVVNSNLITVSSNSINLLSTTQNQAGIFVEAIGANFSDVSITGNNINGGHYAHIRFVNDGNLYQHVAVIGNVCTGGDSTAIPLILESGSVEEAQIIGNTFNSNSATAISQTACIAIRYSGNFATGSGAVLLTSGTCTASFYDRTNYGTGAAGGVSNSATGFIVEQLGTAQPAAGTWARGDMVQNSSPSASSVYMWVCTTAGTSGTWKTISNT